MIGRTEIPMDQCCLTPSCYLNILRNKAEAEAVVIFNWGWLGSTRSLIGGTLVQKDEHFLGPQGPLGTPSSLRPLVRAKNLNHI